MAIIQDNLGQPVPECLHFIFYWILLELWMMGDGGDNWSH